jgi:sugar (pentulose or hexulose) kinase
LSFLAIDLGTSFIKGAVLNIKTGQINHVRRIPFPDPLPGLNPLYCEFDPRDIIETTTEMIHQLAAFAVECEGIVTCTQMSSMVLTNGRGEARSNFFGWRDQRALEPHPSGTGSYYDVLRKRLTEQQRHELGNELPVGAPISFLFWLQEHKRLEPDIIPVSLADFVISTLCCSPPALEVTNAMTYELLNLTTLDWHLDVIEELGLSQVHWPALRRQGEIIGNIQLGGQSVPCYTPVGDYQCALIGALLREDELSLNISTGSQVSRILPRLALGDYQTRPFFDGRFTSTISHLPAGRSLNVLVDLLGELAEAQGTPLQNPWSYIISAAAAVGKADLDVKLSFYPGPCGDRGSIQNICEKNMKVGNLFRAALENMANNYYQCALRIWPDHSWRRIVFSGGLASKIELLRQIIMDRFQTESRLCPVEEDTLFGLLLLAKVFSGNAASVEQATDEFGKIYSILS